ncbi:MAG: ABC transporter permease [Anaerolineae bacterium]|nr:ABC transporter permease [Anaerolineae bacterium]
MLESILSLFNLDFLYAAVRMAIPIILAATGEVFLQRSGIFNIGIEAMMIFGAFFGVLGAALTGNSWLGVLFAMLAGSLTGLAFGFVVITVQGDQTITGTAFSIIGLGLTSFLVRVIWGIRKLPVMVTPIERWPVPVLSEIPYLGRIFFDQSPLAYIAYVLLILATIVMFKTTWGLKVRAVGENPKSAASIGINVIRVRYLCAIFSGSVAGIGGAILSLSELNMFVDNMSGGRGYLAMASVILGRWHPLGAALGGLVFGAGNALQMRLQAIGVPIPNNLLLILPYVLALLIMVSVYSRSGAPAALGVPYEKETTIE